MTKIDLSKPDPDDFLWYKACEGEGCTVILELPFENYNKTKYCSDCREIIIRERKKKYMHQKREESRELAYGDTLTIEANERFNY